MMRKKPAKPMQSRGRRSRRLLFASAVGFGAFAVLAGAGGYGSTAFNLMPSARAEETTMQHPVGFADIVAKVKPAVIAVQVKIVTTADPVSTHQSGSNDGSGSSGASPRRQTITGVGSGFFITPDGYAVTNNHVVEHAKSLQVTTDDGNIYTARVIGTDPKTDLALIKVDGRTDFPYVKFADAEPQIGDWVIAVGNPFGLGGTVTAGIVSARGRDIGSGPYDDYIQIDAPINKGNSGGPAFNVNGEVIGINTAIYSPSGGSVGIGFDIPAETAKMVVSQLKDKGYVIRGWLGVEIQPVTPAIADSLGLTTVAGALVDEPEPGSPAAKAGVESGDVIVAVNGTPIKDARELARMVAMMPPKTKVQLDILRDGKTISIAVVLVRMPNEQPPRTPAAVDNQSSLLPRLGLTVVPAATVPGAGDKGVVVTAVEPSGPAAEQGFKVGNVILDVGGVPVNSADDVRNAMRDAKEQGKHDVLVRVKIGNGTRFVALPLDNA